jgi:fluoroquinolone transport system ATP-binding protein
MRNQNKRFVRSIIVIKVTDLTFTYASGKTPAIRGLNFDIQKGEIFGFLGPSGAGKSTTQKILIGLLQDYQGQVSVLERDLSGWGSDYYERIGVSFEVPNHYLKLTGLENLVYFSSLYNVTTQEPRKLLELVALEEDGDTLVSQYSKGMKNRLNVARAFIHNPELIFMDEPTAGLDPVNARRVKDIIRQQKQSGKTIFLTTHDMTVADELCDRVAFIVDGEISLIDAPRDLKLRYGKPSVRVEVQTNGRREYTDFPLKGLGVNSQFIDLLNNAQVRTIHSLEATLEDVFIQVTGRSLV